MKAARMHGKINVGCLTLIILVSAAGYVSFQFGKVYMTRYFLDKKIFQIAGDAAQDWKAQRFPNEKAIAEAVLREAKNRAVDISYDDIAVERNDRTVTIKVFWEGDIVIPYYTRHFEFTFDHTRQVTY